MKKKIVLFLCIMGIMAALTGCASSSKEIYTPQNIQEKKAKKVADKFVKKVPKEDYKDIKSYIYIPDNTFIKDDDVFWYIERSNLEDIVGMSKKQIVLTNMEKDNTVIDDSDNNNATTRKLTYTTEDSEDYELILVQDRNNNWKIYMPDIYVADYKYKAEKSLTTYINGIEVTSDYIEKNNGVVDDNYITYNIPYVPNRQFTITSSDGFKENLTSNDSDVQIEKSKK